MRDVHVTSVDLCVNGMVTEEKLLLQVRVCYLLFTPQMSTDLVRDGFCLGEQCLHPFHGINIAGPRKERGKRGGTSASSCSGVVYAALQSENVTFGNHTAREARKSAAAERWAWRCLRSARERRGGTGRAIVVVCFGK